ncbi:Zinc finger, CCHC-type superfamily [Sesbania bispinosa]|nr:Zinc finger, CCHC-type superfamily [Sesbania bispinosa]
MGADQGMEIKFEKNDKIRCRVRCKQECDFLALVSKVGGSATYRVKTLVDNHTCGRVFNNKNGKSKWVAKAIADKFRYGQNVRLADIIGDIRSHTKYVCGHCKQIGHNARKCLKRPKVQTEPATSTQPSGTAPPTTSTQPSGTVPPATSTQPSGPNPIATSSQPTQDNPSMTAEPVAQPSQGKSKAAALSNVASGKRGTWKKKTGPSNVAAVPPNYANPAATVPSQSVPTTSTTFPSVPSQSPANEQIKILQNTHNTFQFIQQGTGQDLPPSMVETNNILRDLLVVANKVTYGKEYDWKLVAQQLGLTQIEGYMNFMQQIDEAKKYCATTDPAQLAATNNPAQPAAANDTPQPDAANVGTQHSEVGSTQMGIKRHKGPTN